MNEELKYVEPEGYFTKGMLEILEGKKDKTSRFSLIKGSCAEQDVDAVVNAANRRLQGGSGICGAIFKACGWNMLQAACDACNPPIADGNAVITSAFNMQNAKHIIHAVGPDFGETPNAFLELFNAYYNSLVCLKNNNLHSISFPLISSGIYGDNLPDPAGESAKQCARAYKKFVQDYPDYEVDVVLCAFTDKEYNAAEKEPGIIELITKKSPKDYGRWDNCGIKVISSPNGQTE